MKGAIIKKTITPVNSTEEIINEFYIHSSSPQSNIMKSKDFNECFHNFSQLVPMIQREGIRSYMIDSNIIDKELQLELTRQARFSHFPSRLNSIFAFLDINHAMKFGTGYVYKAKINTDKDSTLSIHNMEEISALRGNNPIASNDNYWQGLMQPFYYPERPSPYNYYPVKKEVLIEGEIFLELVRNPIY